MPWPGPILPFPSPVLPPPPTWKTYIAWLWLWRCWRWGSALSSVGSEPALLTLQVPQTCFMACSWHPEAGAEQHLGWVLRNIIFHYFICCHFTIQILIPSNMLSAHFLHWQVSIFIKRDNPPPQRGRYMDYFTTPNNCVLFRKQSHLRSMFQQLTNKLQKLQNVDYGKRQQDSGLSATFMSCFMTLEKSHNNLLSQSPPFPSKEKANKIHATLVEP